VITGAVHLDGLADTADALGAGRDRERALDILHDSRVGRHVLAESHISMHEWPEHRFVAFDIFVCGSADPEPAIDVIRSRYPSARIQVKVMERGSR